MIEDLLCPRYYDCNVEKPDAVLSYWRDGLAIQTAIKQMITCVMVPEIRGIIINKNVEQGT